MPGGLLQHLVGLSVTKVLFVPEVLSRFHFGFFSPSGLQTFAPQRTANAKKISSDTFLSSSVLSGISFTYRFHHEVTFLLSIATPILFRQQSTYRSSRWSYSCCEQPSLHLRVHYGFPEHSEQGCYVVCHVLLSWLSATASHFIWLDLLDLQVCADAVGFSRRELQPTRWWSLDSSSPVLTLRSNADWNKSFENIDKSVIDRWSKESLHQVCLCKCLCWKNVFMMHSVLLQHSCRRNLPLSFVSASPYWSITPFCTLASFPTCALKSPKRITDSSVLSLRRESLVSLTNHRHSALVFGAYTCIKHKERPNDFKPNTHTVSHAVNHSSPQLAYKYTNYYSLAKHIWRSVCTHRPGIQC